MCCHGRPPLHTLAPTPTPGATHLLAPGRPYARLISEAVRVNTLPLVAAAVAPPPAAVAPAPLRAAAAAGELGVPSLSRSSARSLLLRPTGRRVFSLAAASRGLTRLSLPEGPAAAAAAAAAGAASAVPAGPAAAPLAAAAGGADVSSSLQSTVRAEWGQNRVESMTLQRGHNGEGCPAEPARGGAPALFGRSGAAQ